MKAMILAAGRGERMRPLTDNCPKPLLTIAGTPMIVYLLRALAAAQITEIVINHAWLGEQIEHALGDGSRWGVNIRYSPERQALETAGGIATALPLLGSEPFAVVNGDIWTDFDFAALHRMAVEVKQSSLSGYCILVDKAAHRATGDFAIDPQTRLSNVGEPLLTFAGIALYDPAMFAAQAAGQAGSVVPLLREQARAGKMGAHYFGGQWYDIGTPQRLADINRHMDRINT